MPLNPAREVTYMVGECAHYESWGRVGLVSTSVRESVHLLKAVTWTRGREDPNKPS